MKGVLDGITIIEFAGQGPGPFCGMLLADLGAEVILVERPGPSDSLEFNEVAIFNRGKRSIVLDLKHPDHIEAALRLIGTADGLIEGFRPGVMERLGLGPAACTVRNPDLVYGRMTGWGQDGPLAMSAGHDVNYIALSGALWYASPAGQLPWTPPTLVGDLGGGALFLALGLLGGILHARGGHGGQVVDAAIVDGSASLLNLLLSVQASGRMPDERGQGVLDGAPWYATYRCADGGAVSVGAIEPKFYAALLHELGLEAELSVADQYEQAEWPRSREVFARVFASHTRDAWRQRLEGKECCVTPVLSPAEAAECPHLRARGTYVATGGLRQAAPAPRFSGFPGREPGRIPGKGEHTAEVLASIGLSELL